MSGTIEEYLETMETHQLRTILANLSQPEKKDEYEHILNIIEETIEKREKSSLCI